MDAPHFAEPLSRILAPDAAAVQPPLLARTPQVLHAAIASLALGGAERIVLDWAARTLARSTGGFAVRIAVLRDAVPECEVPSGVEVVRFHGEDLEARLKAFGACAAAENSPVVSCHLLTQQQRNALRAGGAAPVTVLHNASHGWIEPASSSGDGHYAIAVSRAAVAEYCGAGGSAPCKVVRHFPRKPAFRAGAREVWRERWAIPAGAWVIGMIGGVKPQKAYTRAMRILRAVLDRGDCTEGAYLTILGGPVGRDGRLAWEAVLAQARRLDVMEYVRMPGFVPDAAQCLCGFDLLLNTSRYEGLSIATLEALAAGLPVVASRVGGQGEVGAEGLSLLDFEAPDAQWAAALAAHGGNERFASPAWTGFPSERMWTLAHLARPFAPVGRRTLFVTANLNAGGAQRSLVNLALALDGKMDFEIAVTGNSTSSAFTEKLVAAGVRHFRTADSRDCLDHAEVLVARIAKDAPSCVCFWNVDAKLKLLVVKWLAHSAVKFIDVSPGDYLFEEMAATRDFQECIAYSETEYYARLDRLVHKYRARSSGALNRKVVVIHNGVPFLGTGVPVPGTPVRADAPKRAAKIAICGRIAPGKFLLEAIEAMERVWKHAPEAQLHILGNAEPRQRDYAMRVVAAAGPELARGSQSRVVFHGPAFDASEGLAQYDALLVLGRHQGCPNTVLEGLVAGVPVIANDSGGTRELVIHGKTGLLLGGMDPEAIAAAILRLIENPALARTLAMRGRVHVRKHFSMERMRDRYLRLFR